MESTINKISEAFASDVAKGLAADPKFLSSRYFYDARGDQIFQQIMKMPEYYLTACEYEIFNQQKDALLKAISRDKKFSLVELGAGDGYKTKVLLAHFLERGVNFEYYPVDISKNVLLELKKELQDKFPDLVVTPLNYEYFTALERLNQLDDSPKTILFLGGNMGNFSAARAHNFYNKLHEVMQPGDQVLNGIDLKKNPRNILKAYNDESGITKAFNLNLLNRINRELGGNFKTRKF
ncbi:MAG: L-histidine N(alpha)-methyltransferase [Owenweeksia sp.]|nr:L-histidine N(alpha)-methyltransferase [Owenweeksia sp.]